MNSSGSRIMSQQKMLLLCNCFELHKTWGTCVFEIRSYLISDHVCWKHFPFRKIFRVMRELCLRRLKKRKQNFMRSCCCPIITTLVTTWQRLLKVSLYFQNTAAKAEAPKPGHRHTSPPLGCFHFVKKPNSWFKKCRPRFNSSQSSKSMYRVFIH